MNPAWRKGALLALVVLAVLGPFVQQYTAPAASRYALTAAIVDEGTVALDAYRHALDDVDRAVHDGRVFSDKAPGQPVLAVAPYAAYRLVGGEPATVLRVREHLGLWWVTWWSSTVPVALLAALMWSHARTVDDRWATASSLAVTFGAPLALYATHLYGHALAAALGFGGWLLARSRPLSWGRAMVSGFVLGAGIATEYPVAIIALVTGASVARHSVRRALAMGIGALIPLALLLSYNAATFDHPLRPGISTKPQIRTNGFFGIGPPRLENLSEMFLGERNVIVHMPLVVVVLALGWLLVVRRADGWREVSVPLAVVSAFLLIPLGWDNPWGGEEPVPRYLVPALPFLAAPCAWLLARWPRAVAAAAATGGAVMALAILTFHMVAIGASPVARYLVQLGRGDVTPTLFTMALGPGGWVVHAALVVAVAAAARRAFRSDHHPTTAAPTSATAAT